MDDIVAKVVPVAVPNSEDWERVSDVRALLKELVISLGQGEVAVCEAVVRLCALEGGWSSSQTAMATAMVLGNATKDNIEETVIPF